MPKPGAPISHDAIKRSLKSKFKLIVSENRILVETINGYVKRVTPHVDVCVVALVTFLIYILKFLSYFLVLQISSLFM